MHSLTPPLPRGPWILFQRWHDLLFAHWPVAPESLARRLPPGIELDLHEGEAWLGIVPFRMSGVRLRCLPPLPGAAAFPEINVRTYVRRGEHRGVWFFSLDAASQLAVRTARRLAHLPYFHAGMECRARDGVVAYRSSRKDERAAGAEFEATYSASEALERARTPPPGSLADFLTARFCLFTSAPGGVLLRLDIHHPPWRLVAASASLRANSMAAAAGIPLPDSAPLLHLVAQPMDVLFWRPVRVR